MNLAPSGLLPVEFEGATLSSVDDQTAERSYTVGWFVQKLDVNAASTRYRCLHFARVLGPEFRSIYLTSLADVQKVIHDVDAIVVVKRLDRTVLDVVGIARLFAIPVFLDLCDDLIAPGYSKNDFGTNLLHFLGMAPFLEGVTASSSEMADRIEGYASSNGYPNLPIHVVPDVAETWEIFRATYKSTTGTEPTDSLPEENGRNPDLKQVAWFGNYGSSHSNFGLYSLKPSLKVLEAVHREIPLELVIVSNNEAVYRALVRNCGFPTRYVEWSASAVYDALGTADVALLTTGDDEFCSIKSSNRVLQALAADVPVITAKNSSLAEFEDIIFSGPLEESLKACLGPARRRVVPPRLAAAERLLQRYSPERLGGIWAHLLRAAIGRSLSGRATAQAGRILFVAEAGDDVPKLKALLSAAKGINGLKYDLLVSTELVEQEPSVSSALAMSRSIPRFFSGRLRAARNLLLGRSALVVERPSAPVGKLLAGFAAQLGIRVLTSSEAAAGGLREFVDRKSSHPGVTSVIRAGPNEEWSHDDGSVDWAFVVHRNARGWILDAICREIGSRQPGSWRVVYHPDDAPPAKNLFFSHYLLLENYLESRPERLKDANLFVWYTHPRVENPVKVAKLLLAFERATKVIFACESNRQVWLKRGLPKDKTKVVLGAADPSLFRYHERGDGVVGLSSSFYERKNPDCLLEVIKILPHRQFVLLGRKWNQYALFEEMRALPNFRYVSAPYSEYPDIYATFDVFLSMSNLEGGPIPLVEAMMSNAVPVASRTGFAPDLIRHGENGFIFDLDASAKTIAEMIEAAYALPTNVRETVEQYDWDRFSQAIVKLAG